MRELEGVEAVLFDYGGVLTGPVRDSIAEFEALLAAELLTAGRHPVVAEGLLSRIFGGLREDDGMFALVDELKMRGIKIGLVSNSWGNGYPRDRIDRAFDAVVISGEVGGLRRPHPEIYELAMARLDVTPGRALFIDDAQPNVLGAQRVGMRDLLHTSSSETRRAMTGLTDPCHEEEGRIE